MLVDNETKQARLLHLAITKGYASVHRYLDCQVPPITREPGDNGALWHAAYQAIQLTGAIRTTDYFDLHRIKLRWRRYATLAITRHQTSIVDTMVWGEKARTSRMAYNRDVANAKMLMSQARRELGVVEWRRVHQIGMGYLLRHYMLEDTSDEMAV